MLNTQKHSFPAASPLGSVDLDEACVLGQRTGAHQFDYLSTQRGTDLTWLWLFKSNGLNLNIPLSMERQQLLLATIQHVPGLVWSQSESMAIFPHFSAEPKKIN